MRAPVSELSPVDSRQAEDTRHREMRVGSESDILPGVGDRRRGGVLRNREKTRTVDPLGAGRLFRVATRRLARVAGITAALALAQLTPAAPGMPDRPRPRVAAYLPAIAWVESRSNQWAVSYRGPAFGRGLHGISEICFEHWTWVNWNHWVVKQKLDPTCLFNAGINEEVALWFLGWLENYYRNKWNPEPWILSAYCYGPTYTDQHGPQRDYVTLVKLAMTR